MSQSCLFLLFAKDRVNSSTTQREQVALAESKSLCNKEVLIGQIAAEDANIISLLAISSYFPHEGLWYARIAQPGNRCSSSSPNDDLQRRPL